MNVIVVGGGKVGTTLAELLQASGHRVRLIEERSEVLSGLPRNVSQEHVILGSGSNPDVLERADIRHADVVAAVTGADETNLIVTSLARFAFNVPRTIARINDPNHAWMFTTAMGVDVAFNPADLMAHLIAEEMSLGDMMTLLKLRKGQYSLVEEQVHPRAQAVGQPLHALPLPNQCVLVAVLRGGQLIIPFGDLVLQPADEVLALVHRDQLAALAALLNPMG